jgi:hypothetical protein
VAALSHIRLVEDNEDDFEATLTDCWFGIGLLPHPKT